MNRTIVVIALVLGLGPLAAVAPPALSVAAVASPRAGATVQDWNWLCRLLRLCPAEGGVAAAQ